MRAPNQVSSYAHPAWLILILSLAPTIGLGIGRFAYSLVLPDMAGAPDSDCCRAHKTPVAVVQTVRPLLAAAPNRRCDMSDTGLDFQLGEMADTIRESTERFARDETREPVAT